MTRNPGLNNRTDNSIMNDDLSISKICYTTQKMNISFFLKFFMFTLLFLLLHCLFNSTCKKLDYNDSLRVPLDLSMKRLLSEYNCNKKKSESQLNLLEEWEKQCEDEKEKEDKEKSSSSLSLSRRGKQLASTNIEMPTVNSSENKASKSRSRKRSVFSHMLVYTLVTIPYLISALALCKMTSNLSGAKNFCSEFEDTSIIITFLVYITITFSSCFYGDIKKRIN